VNLSRLIALSALLSLSSVAAAAPREPVAPVAPRVSSLLRADVTVYGASWCSACRSLEKTLRERNVPFDVVDVDKSPQAYERARAAAGAANVVPLTGVLRGEGTVWFVGADADGVERAYRGE
jgi:glutaredoxin